MNNVTYTLEHVRFGYGSSEVLHGLSHTFSPGQVHAIVGPNGSGKSTLLDLLAGLHAPTSGTITIDDMAITELAPNTQATLIAMVPQEFNFNFPFTVFDAVLMGRHPHIPRFSRPSHVDTGIVESAMTTMDIAHFASRPLSELSGGEKQRTVFARALAQRTPMLLLDEPTSSMDIRHALGAMKELKRLANEEQCTIITVLHDLNLAATYCDQVLVLKEGQIFTHGTPAEAFTPDTIQNVFGVHAEISQRTASSNLVITYESKE